VAANDAAADNAALASLAATQPSYRFWAERHGDGRTRYVAQRLPGSAVNPVAVVTPDLAELRDTLTGQHGQAVLPSTEKE
jgi:hypothetical protein